MSDLGMRARAGLLDMRTCKAKGVCPHCQKSAELALEFILELQVEIQRLTDEQTEDENDRTASTRRGGSEDLREDP